MRRCFQIFGFAILFAIRWSSFNEVIAGALDRFAFTPAGLRIDLSTASTVANDLIFMNSAVTSLCTDASGKVCISWDLVLDDVSHQTEYTIRISEAIQIWNSNSALRIQMQFANVIASNPSPTGTDTFGNPQTLGNFVVSFAPPGAITFNSDQVSTTQHYVFPDLSKKKGEIRWAAIYFNPALTPGKDYDLRTALLHEMGRALGLSPSDVTASVMYPVKIGKTFKSVLHSDDLLWASNAYATNAFSVGMGSLSGDVVNGNDDSPIIGAHIQVLSTASAQTFADSLDRKLFTSGTYSYEQGKFKFLALPPGDYLIFLENPASPSSLDSWLRKFSSPTKFEAEFYDGADRESNQEAIYAFTPQSISYAATVTVMAGQETSGVTFVTNVADPKIQRIVAKGSTAEKLSGSQPPAEKSASDLPEETKPTPSSGGCSLSEESRPNWDFLNLLATAFALFLLLRVRQDLRAK